MIFIIPIIIGAAALLTGSFGVASGAEGISKSKDANKIGKDAQKRYEYESGLAEKRFKITQSFAEEYQGCFILNFVILCIYENTQFQTSELCSFDG